MTARTPDSPAPMPKTYAQAVKHAKSFAQALKTPPGPDSIPTATRGLPLSMPSHRVDVGHALTRERPLLTSISAPTSPTPITRAAGEQSRKKVFSIEELKRRLTAERNSLENAHSSKDSGNDQGTHTSPY